MVQDKFKDHLKITCYSRPQKKTTDLIRIEAELENVDPHKLWKYITDPPSTEYYLELKSFDKVGDNQVDQYYVMKFPMMTDRDNIVRIKRQPLTADSFYLTAETFDHPDYPPQKKYVRMFQTMQTYVRPNPAVPGNYFYTEISNFDIKGSVPVRLLNMIFPSEAVGEMTMVTKYMQK